MYTINKSAAIVRPKQPFMDWVNRLPDADTEREVTLADFGSDCAVILIPEYDSEKEARKYIDRIALEILENELYGWCTHEPWWPKKRSRKMFLEWFDVELHSEIIDFSNEAIKKESF